MRKIIGKKNKVHYVEETTRFQKDELFTQNY